MSIAKLQRRLKTLGLYDGEITRDANKALREAIQRYHDRHISDPEVDRLIEQRASR